LESAKLSVSINGAQKGYFDCKRGVRQGDPLSLLLFCIAEDVLSRGILKLVQKRKLNSSKLQIKAVSPLMFYMLMTSCFFVKGRLLVLIICRNYSLIMPCALAKS